MPPKDFSKLSKEQILEAISNDDAAVLQALTALIKDYLARGFALEEAGKDPQSLSGKAVTPIEKLALSMAMAALASNGKKTS
jgi:chromosome segregation and condensation protein ScpB